MGKILQVISSYTLIVIGLFICNFSLYMKIEKLSEDYDQLELRFEALERRVFMHGEY